MNVDVAAQVPAHDDEVQPLLMLDIEIADGLALAVLDAETELALPPGREAARLGDQAELVVGDGEALRDGGAAVLHAVLVSIGVLVGCAVGRPRGVADGDGHAEDEHEARQEPGDAGGGAHVITS